MANRKVLINRHTTGNTAPNAAEMFHGEIAVAHKTGEEILWTKNNANEMVPFISCAQTISIVSGMIQDADIIYNVVTGTGEQHLDVEENLTAGTKTFTLTSKDVQSEEEFKAYIDGYLITKKFFGEIEIELRHAVAKFPKFCEDFTEDKSGMLWQTRAECVKARNAHHAPTAESVLMEKIAETFNAYQHGDKRGCLKNFAQVGAFIFRCMEHIQNEMKD